MRYVASVAVLAIFCGCAAGSNTSAVPSANGPATTRAATYSIVDLGAGFNPTRLNASSVVVGSVPVSASAYEAAMYANGTVQRLGRYPGDAWSVANGVNSAGQIVGESYGTTSENPMLFRPGQPPKRLATRRVYPYGSATAIDDNGAIVGWGIPQGGCSEALEYTLTAKPVVLPFATAAAINDWGSVVGVKTNYDGGGCHDGRDYVALARTNGAAHKIPSPPDSFQTDDSGGPAPTDLDNRGDIVGYYTYCGKTGCASNAVRIAGFEYVDGKVTSVYSPFKSDPCLKLFAIDRERASVGTICQGGTMTRSRAIVVKNGVVTDLNGAIPAGSGWWLQSASDISDNGVIVGLGTLAGQAHGFMLLAK